MLSLVLMGALASVNCSSGSGGTGTGGSTGSGGSNPTGSGGSPGTGGSPATGGATGSGGAPSTGGTTGTGGTATGGGTGTGGSTGTGGTAGSGASTGSGGAGGSGGSAGRGGGTGGGGGSATGGAGGATNCAGHAISFNANVAGGNDPAKAAVLVNFNGSTALPTANTTRTIEFWAYVPTTAWAGDVNTMFFYGPASSARNNDGFGLDFGKTTSSGIGTIDAFTNNDTTDPMGDNKASGLMANTAQWAHFAMTWDGTTLHAYVNGVEKVTVPVPNMLHTGASVLTIGGYPPNYFNGQIDEFRIWNVARSAAEIMSTMNHTLVGNEPGLTGYWKFDETSGTTAADSAMPGGHPGMLSANTASNNPTWVVSAAPLSCP
jgi:hypothetical protein